MATLAAGAALLAASNPVPAHVKWFAECEYGTHSPATDVLGRPLFWILLLAAATAVALLRELEHTSIGQALALRVLQVQQRLADLRCRVLICSTIFFLAAIATTGNLILSPELTTQLTAVRWLQALAAIALFARRGEPVAGVALLALFGIGLAEYGAFHMIDYLIVLGLALYFLVPRWPSATRIRFLRVAAALSLMWVSVEKWVFPGWVMQIVHDHPLITFGFPQTEFVVLAGVVEFALGFGLMWRGFYSVVSALILAVFMSAAILEFGFVDLVGHIVILGVLLAIALDRIAPAPQQPPTWSPAAALLASCAAVLLVYYGIVYTLHGSGTAAQMAAQAQPIAPTAPARLPKGWETSMREISNRSYSASERGGSLINPGQGSELFKNGIEFRILGAASEIGNGHKNRRRSDEHRYLIVGESSRGRLLIVSYAERGDLIRVISARELTSAEQEEYEEGEHRSGR